MAMPVYRPDQFDSKFAAHMRKLVRRARELLQGGPSADTFMGRRTQEPFPREDEHIERWIGSRELRPPE